MTQSPIVSVVIGAYNAGGYIEAALSSVLRQSVTDIDVIVVDDGSTDNTVALVKAIRDQDRRVRLLRQEKAGLAAALNYAISEAKAPWIARMDADDISHPRRFERQLKHLELFKTDLCGTGVRRFGTRFARRRWYPRSTELIKLWICFGSPFAHPTVLGKRSIFINHAYNTSLHVAQDYELWTRMLLAGVRMSNLESIELSYRVHSKQLSTEHSAAQANARRLIQQAFLQRYVPEQCDLFLKFSGLGEVPSLSDFEALLGAFDKLGLCGDAEKKQLLGKLAARVRPLNADVLAAYQRFWHGKSSSFSRDDFALWARMLMASRLPFDYEKLMRKFVQL